jgi:hypothetical protein
MVAALAEELRSPFRGRKPERREDHRKRTRRSETIGAAHASTLHSPLALKGAEALEEGGELRGNKTTKERSQEGPLTQLQTERAT